MSTAFPHVLNRDTSTNRPRSRVESNRHGSYSHPAQTAFLHLIFGTVILLSALRLGAAGATSAQIDAVVAYAKALEYYNTENWKECLRESDRAKSHVLFASLLGNSAKLQLGLLDEAARGYSQFTHPDPEELANAKSWAGTCWAAAERWREAQSAF